MGANQSSPSTGSGNTASPEPTVSTFRDDDDDKAVTETKMTFHNDDKASQLSGVPLIEYKCRKKEKAWKNCVKNFYTEQFLPGQSMDQETYCGEKFEAYRRCYLRGMKKVIWDKKGTKATDHSFLAEFEDEEDE
ncbi:predicted protein [Phaeodactylum tricornutum CCAP 1055/1]|jgi:hypothetical protein|uniref:Uncharacterized protein n=1 Tax=Phaeodactylum tricornutum (strain CCAP 1055/1) TaxID=556484 RepID=B7G1C7_PHATC|nr:predicted protein [Phaeodactylum tricornutum CCAP 1055/1]EEC47482.1 predicted protein [Phaeodactylum tricornutum CCAP 1055/1]|eukprot:XP_002180830.1 predicted protein [Phaeodactylum tricornutum CCAP 1055/1]